MEKTPKRKNTKRVPTDPVRLRSRKLAEKTVQEKVGSTLIPKLAHAYRMSIVTLRWAVRKWPRQSLAGLLLVLLLVLMATRDTRAGSTVYHPTRCLGGWENPQLAEGAPNVSPDGDLSEFTSENSAVLKDISTQLYCDDFGGETPTNVAMERVYLTFSWRIGDLVPGGASGNEATSEEDVSTNGSGGGGGSSGSKEKGGSIIVSPSAIEEEVMQSIIDAPSDADVVIMMEDAVEEPVEQNEAPSATEEDANPEPTPAQENTGSEGVEPNDSSAPSDPEAPLSWWGKLWGSAVYAEEGAELSISEPSETNSPDLFEVQYSLDGILWEHLGTVSTENWHNIRMEVPIMQWENISSLQIRIDSLPFVGDMPPVYLDAMTLTVAYEKPFDVYDAEQGELGDGGVEVNTETLTEFVNAHGSDFKADEEPIFIFDEAGFIRAAREEELLQDEATSSATSIPTSEGVEQPETIGETEAESAVSDFVEDSSVSEEEQSEAFEDETPAQEPTPQEEPVPEETPVPEEEPAPEENTTNDTLPEATEPSPESAPESTTPAEPSAMLQHAKDYAMALLEVLDPAIKIAHAQFWNTGTAKILEAEVYKGGVRTDMVPQISEFENMSTIRIPRSGNAFEPGKYTLRLKVRKGDTEYVTHEDFGWGMLALNTDKSAYEVGDTARFGISALQDAGGTLCNAPLSLDIQYPSGYVVHLSTHDAGITKEDTCGMNTITDVPDYTTQLRLDERGVYTLTLTDHYTGSSIEERVIVAQHLPFVIERKSATRINPFLDKYEMRVLVTARQAFKGSVVEILPKEFDVSDTEADIDKKSIGMVLTWDVDLSPNEQVELTYTYEAPTETPRFYLVGPLAFFPSQNLLEKLFEGGAPALYKEPRAWQVVSDGDEEVIASIATPLQYFDEEGTGAELAHTFVLDNTGDKPDYKWRFLEDGVTLMINRNDGAGWVELVGRIRAVPQYTAIGASGGVEWQPYDLTTATSSESAVLQSWKKELQKDGSVLITRDYLTNEAGVSEVLTEEWLIPEDAERLGKGPKVTYYMTKNRGLVETSGATEGLWRLAWSLSGISDITEDDYDLRDESGYPVVAKEYESGDLTVDINDFDNLQSDGAQHTYSEIGATKEARIVFYPSGTEGERVIDPTTVVTNVTPGWTLAKQRLVYYNNSNYFLFYTKGAGIIYYNADADASGTWDKGETALINGQSGTYVDFDIYMVDATTWDIVYTDSSNGTKVVTATASGNTLSTSTASTNMNTVPCNSVTVSRTPSADRIWATCGDTAGKDMYIYSANSTGAANNVSGWTAEHTDTGAYPYDAMSSVPYENTDEVLVMYNRNPGGTAGDGVYGLDCVRSSACSTQVEVGNLDNTGEVSNPVRVSDTDFRYLLTKSGAAIAEYTWNDSTWTEVDANIDPDNETDETSPSLFYDGSIEYLYAFAVDSTSEASVEMWNKYLTDWSTELEVDDGDVSEPGNRSLPITMMHRILDDSTVINVLPFAYRTANTNFDLKVGTTTFQEPPIFATTTVREYAFFNDNGSDVNSKTKRSGSSTSTPITSVKKGERMVLRFQLDTDGNDPAVATSTENYRLQWENYSDAPGTWNDLSTTTEIAWSLSYNGARWGRPGPIPLATSSGSITTSCTGGATYIGGQLVAGFATSTAVSIKGNQCMDLAYTIHTGNAQLSDEYHFRLIHGSDNEDIEAAGGLYDVYPALTIESATTTRYSKESRGTSTEVVLDLVGDTGIENSLAIGVDGLPFVMYRGTTTTNNFLVFSKCQDISCFSVSSTTVDTIPAVYYSENTVAVGSDGFPVSISQDFYGPSEIKTVVFTKCYNLYCTNFSTSTIDWNLPDSIDGTSITIGPDGLPLMFHTPMYAYTVNSKCHDASCINISSTTLSSLGYSTGGGNFSSVIDSEGFPMISYSQDSSLYIARCSNLSCTEVNYVLIGNGGKSSSIALGADGFPVVSHARTSSVNFVKCNNSDCSSATEKVLDASASADSVSLAIGIDGFPVIAYLDASVKKLMFAKCHDISCTSVSTSTQDSPGIKSYRLSVAIGVDGFPLISYHNGDNHTAVMKCNSLDCSNTSLVTDDSDMDYYLDDSDYTALGTSDNSYDILRVGPYAEGGVVGHSDNDNNTDQIAIVWEGKVSVATTTSLQIYNYNSSAWETLQSNSSPTPGSDFTLSGTQTTSLADYYDPSDTVAARVVLGTTTNYTELSTDFFTVSMSPPIIATTTVRQYAFFNDNGSDVNSNTKRSGSSTSTPITGVKKGERMVLRFQLDTDGNDPTAATSTKNYRLQWENYSDAPGTWNDLSTTTEIAWSLSDNGARWGRSGPIPLATSSGSITTSCTGDATYIGGQFVSGFATSTPMSIKPDQCMDLAYTIHTGNAQLSDEYHFRLIHGTDNEDIETDGGTYAVYPALTIESATTTRYSKESRGNYATSSPDWVGNVGDYSSMAIGIDGYPVISYYDSSNGNLNFVKCYDIACTSSATSTLDQGGSVGSYTSIAIGIDGYPVISYHDVNNANLNFVKCYDIACTSSATSTLDQAGLVGYVSSIAIGIDGYPVISYQDGTNKNLNFVKCYDIACTSSATSTLDQAGLVGADSSIAIGIDGYPVISYSDSTNRTLNFVKCYDIACISSATSTIALNGGGDLFMAIGTDGYPVISYKLGITDPKDLNFLKCYDIACTSTTTSTIDQAGDTGDKPSMAIGIDGYPVISYFSYDSLKQNLAKCHDVACTNSATSTIDSVGNTGASSIAIGIDGYPVISYFTVSSYDLIFAKCNSLDCSNISLLANDLDLDSYLDAEGYTAIESSDDSYDVLRVGSYTEGAVVVHSDNDNNTDPIIISWEGQVSVATTTTLQIYNYNSASWETLQSNDSPTPGSDFTLSGTQSSSLSNYYDPSDTVAARVVLGTTTNYTELSTDMFTVNFTSAATTTVRQYMFYNDNGSEVNSKTIRSGASTSTAITSVKKGERMVLRFQLDTDGGDPAAATSTKNYRLQWENYSDAPGTWNDLSTTTEIAWSLSYNGARWGRPGPIPLATSSGSITTSCTGGATYIGGQFVAGFATSTAVSINPDQCMDLAYTIHTGNAQLSDEYHFRLIHGTDNEDIETAGGTYGVYPSLTIEGATTTRYSKESRGTSTVVILDSGNDAGRNSSVAIGIDGLPVISYYYATLSGKLGFIKCNDFSCVNKTTRTLDSVGDTGYYSSIAVGSDGYPVISYITDFISGNLTLIKCYDESCESLSSSIVDSNEGNQMSSVAIGLDGFPIVSYYSSAYDLSFAKCHNLACTNTTPRTLDPSNGTDNSITMGSDGFPIISYLNNQSLGFIKCNNADCTNVSSTTLDSSAGDYSSIALGIDGLPVISYKDSNGGIGFVKCNNVECTSAASTTLDSTGGAYTSTAIGVDGLPVVSYRNASSDLIFVKCNNIDCTNTASTTIASGISSMNTSVAIAADGFPIIVYQNGTSDLSYAKCNSLDCSNISISQNNSDLDSYLDDDGYTAVAAIDSVYDVLRVASSSVGAMVSHVKHTNNVDQIQLNWEGKISVSTTTSLQVYNYNSGEWETLAENTSPTPDTDFELIGLQALSLSEYYDPSYTISARILVGTTTEYSELSTDRIKIKTGIFNAATTTVREYAFFNDNGSDVNSKTKRAGSSTSTPITSVKKGERMVLRFQLDTDGNDPAAATSTKNYRLQWENYSDAPGTWNDLSTTTEIAWSLSYNGARWGRPGPIPLATSSGSITTSCTGGATYIGGQFVAGFATSTAVSINPDQCMDLAYTIHTGNAQLSDEYHFRLIHGTDNEDIETAGGTYSVYPSLTIEGATTTRYSKESRGTSTEFSVAIDTLGEGSFAIGMDNLLVFVYKNAADEIVFTKCNDMICSSPSATVIGVTSFVGAYSTVVIGSDGLPIVTYMDDNYDLAFVKCYDSVCTTSNPTVLHSGGGIIGYSSSITIGPDGFPMVSYHINTGEVIFAKCGTMDCTSAATTTIGTGTYSSLTLGSDGLPIISYTNSDDDISFVKCNDVVCTSVTTPIVLDSVGSNYDSAIALGIDGFPVISYYQDALGSDDLGLIKCNDVTCTNAASSTLDSAGVAGRASSIAIGIDGFPVIAYVNGDSDMGIIKCNDVTCTNAASTTLGFVGSPTSKTRLIINSNGFPVINQGGDEDVIQCNSFDCSIASVSSNDFDLDSFLDSEGYTAVETSDDSYDFLRIGTSSEGTVVVHSDNDNSTDQIGVTWEGQVNVATTTTLQIYNYTSDTWETLQSNSSPTPDTDFTLSGTQTTSLADYYDPSDTVAARVVLGTTTQYTELSTDQFVVTFTLPVSSATTTVREYAFFNDNGSDVNSKTKRSGSSTSTPITSVKKGERMVLRFQLDTDGNDPAVATSTENYRLQWENYSDAPGTWNDLSTTTEIAWSLSYNGARWGRSGPIPLATSSGSITTSCTGGATYIGGQLVAGFATSTAVSIKGNQCMDLAYTIHTGNAQLSDEYHFRLIHGSDNEDIEAAGGLYDVYPALTIESATTTRYSKESRGNVATSTTNLSPGGFGLNQTVATGKDGLPVISYAAFDGLGFVKCNNTDCADFSRVNLDNSSSAGTYNSVAFGVDGFPVIVYFGGNGILNIVRCFDVGCTSAASTTLEAAEWTVNHYIPIAIGPDGLPVFVNNNMSSQLVLYKCINTTCTNFSSKVIAPDASNPSLTIGSDGLPVVSFYSYPFTAKDLVFLKCNDATCSDYSSTVLDSSGNTGAGSAVSIGADGNPFISYINGSSKLGVVKCSTADCTSAASTTYAGISAGVTYTEVGIDGLPIVSTDATILKCANFSCTSGASTTHDTFSPGRSPIAIGSDGLPFISYANTNNKLSSLKCNSLDCRTTSVPATDTDLDYYMDNAGYTALASSNDVYDVLRVGSSTQGALVFHSDNTNNTDSIEVTWEGQVDVATTTTLQIYNYTSDGWETLDSNSSPTPDTDFTLSGTQSTSLSDYYDPSDTVTLRILVGTTTSYTELSSDHVSIVFGGGTFTFGTDISGFGGLNPDTYSIATATLSMITDNVAGYNVSLTSDDRTTTETVMDLDTDTTVGITDRFEWVAGAATTSAGNAASVVPGNEFLAFRVMTASGSAPFIATDWWGIDDELFSINNLWAGVASSSAANIQIGNSSVSAPSAAYSTVQFYLDVPVSQKIGDYSGSITFTATPN